MVSEKQKRERLAAAQRARRAGFQERESGVRGPLRRLGWQPVVHRVPGGQISGISPVAKQKEPQNALLLPLPWPWPRLGGGLPADYLGS